MGNMSSLGRHILHYEKRNVYLFDRNVVVHTITSWIMAWALVIIGQMFMPFSFQLGLIVFKLIVCIIQEPPFGVRFCIPIHNGYTVLGCRLSLFYG